ncbi:hypothetical protein M407DRAFT_24461 [Tulasnella calospora MUT 4182]|uniref:Uncharacterized protein n=1 Tax=Tulasnella calospora MUT 4182 TaxID=1051891 RepID=A0A0C3LXP1_9AGAM|nr:hypothetical protein M407DRAFT_24461 [Tulasnella calospora MUT 4182]
MSLTPYPAAPAPETYLMVEETLTPSSINWKNSIVVPTRTVILPSFSATLDSLPEPTASSSSPKSGLLSTRSITYAAIVTSVIICIAVSVLLYRWCTKHRTKVPKASSISKPAVIQNGLSTWSLDSQAGLSRALSEEKRVEWMEKGLPVWSPNTREAMSARVLTRSVKEASCGIKTSGSNGTMLSRSDTDNSVSSGGTTVKQSQDIDHGATAVRVGYPALDQRRIDDMVDGALTAPLGYPKRVLAHGDQVEAVKHAHFHDVVAKPPESLGGHVYI